MDLISKTLDYVGKNYDDIFVIQIGAMDGVSFDDTRGFLDLYKWNSLLVEPVPFLFKKLKNNFKDRNNYIFEMSAISDKDGEVKMLTIPSEVIEKEELHPGYEGMSAVYPLKNGFGSNYQRDIDVKNKFGINIKVPSLTFKSLLKKHNIQNFDILICDAEGHDWKIFKQIDLNVYRPKFIRLEYINLTEEEKSLVISKLKNNGYIFEIGQDIDAVDNKLWNKINVLKEKKYPSNDKNKVTDDFTLVTGVWDIGREDRDFDFYIEHLKNLLKVPFNLFLNIPKELESLVWEYRKEENTHVRIFELDDIKNLYSPHWDKTQKIRLNPEWSSGSWVQESPQATLEYYNPIVQSKMFLLHDAKLINPFSTDYFFWIDAALPKTVHIDFLKNEKFKNITNHANPFLFLSFPYTPDKEIHGFDIEGIKKYVPQKTSYVCRGGLFGGHQDQISETNAVYYDLLQKTLDDGYMGTEESIFTIMAHNEPHIYKRYMLNDDGLIYRFVLDLLDDNITLESIPVENKNKFKKVSNRDLKNVKTNVYILTFNFPEQLKHILSSFEKVPDWLKKPNLIIIDNSTLKKSVEGNKKTARKYGAEYIHLGDNKGINGGRQFSAEHFHESDADFMIFFEDDMTLNPPEASGEFCRKGFRKYVDNLYDIIHKIMLKENFDFLKLSFSAVFWDNNIQTSWYNVPQSVRDEIWPDYNKLPVNGSDPNSPRTTFNTIDEVDNLSYITGEVFYCNWPMIVSKEGNKKIFIDTKWENPFEQTWMSYVFQETLKGNIRPALLLASPIYHDRIMHYLPEERREN